MENKEKYISLGSSCVPALTLRKLKLKTETYPFDWVRTNNKIIHDMLLNGTDKFLAFDVEVSNDYFVNEMYKFHYGKGTPNGTLVNAYGQHFTHYKRTSTDKLVERFSRYCDRFFDVLKSDHKILFVQTHEDYIVHKAARDAQEELYDYLCKIEGIFNKKYPNLDYHIINVEIDNPFENTKKITNLSIEYDLPITDKSENLRKHVHLKKYRSSVSKAIKQFLDKEWK
jgi:hypothetical protein